MLTVSGMAALVAVDGRDDATWVFIVGITDFTLAGFCCCCSLDSAALPAVCEASLDGSCLGPVVIRKLILTLF